ncbi:MAG: peptidoglycan DD-metalloendopeptidase family protein [Acidobacteriota bacterium]|nr:peptidoglycan DD-metalloendopeptidase family protein [Acidobacteriota bacterium]
MVRDERLYAFIISYTSRSRSRIRQVCLHKKWLKVSAVLALVIMAGAAYGFYGLTQTAAHFRIEQENERLRAETDRQRRELNELNQRVEAVEDTSRKLAEKSGVVNSDDSNLHGAGGPAIPLNASGLAALEAKMSRVEQEMSVHEAVLRERGFTPSIWPVNGKLESGFGGRRNPFGGSSFEFHDGQDIVVPSGTPVIAGAKGTVTFVGWMNGYGRLIEIDHGGGLTTRYGHLSEFDVEQGKDVARGEFIGRVGSTGRSTGPHLHYEVRINDNPVNPLQYLLTSAKQ